MVEQILLSSGSFAGMRETGGFGQPLHALYPQIRAVLASELGPEAAVLLAEPVVDRVNDRIDWYTEGDPDHPPAVLSDLPEEQRQPLLARVHDLLDRGREVAERYAASKEARRAQLGAMLRVALSTPAETELFLVEGRPVMIRWGFTPDRPWETATEPARSPVVPPSAPRPTEPPRDVAMPEMALPELAAAPKFGTEPLPLTESPPVAPLPTPAPEPPPESVPPSKPALPPALSEHPPELPSEANPPPAAIASQAPQESQSESETPRSAAAPLDAAVESKSGSKFEFGAQWRYVVVGSRYFWSVFALAGLLAVVAAFWWGMGWPAPFSASGQGSKPVLDTDLERALTQAQHTETELRSRLESLLTQLAERRGQCPLPAVRAGAAVPAIREPGQGRAAPAQSTVAVAGGNSSREPAVTASANNPVAIPTVDAPTAARAATTPGMAPPADRAAGPATATPIVPDHAVSPTAMPPVSAIDPPDSVGPPSSRPESRASSETKSPTRTLEEVLVERAPVAGAPARQSPSSRTEPPAKVEPLARTEPPAKKAEPPALTEPPVKAEPTAEERREFTSRMTATGATTGEITATLLWNGPGDLDLVVHCPSGQQLDYRNPDVCGGALDVDANATRGTLSDRPVENAFWPAGRAAPGNYGVAVRYAPRKDEQNLQETPFQVRLIRGGQESVFKGTVRPNAITPVTTFTVER
ncbi:MAG: hypothetical protein RKO66_06735 [Candidatus Contendobacter sp.]|nr:hypothetical protein [Candidatus Contendobacter sp.]MDS4057281.1 hypothetical protein [Candidatus Contendobacter sp.]